MRNPTIQASADRLLTLWQDYQFQFELHSFDSTIEIFRRVARAIPLSRWEGGGKHASTFTFEFRDREDPRFADRRMQGLLRVIFENLHKADPSQTSQLLYSVVKLRLPEDHLISALVGQCED